MFIDVHAHFSHHDNKEIVLAALEKYNISRVYLSNPCLYGYYPSKEEVDMQNDEIIGIVKDCPEKLRYMCYLNPALDNTCYTLEKAVEDNNAKGIKLWVATYCDALSVNPVAELAIKYNIPILIHTFHKYEHQLSDESVGSNVANIAKRYPEAKFIMAHMGGDAYHGVKYIKNLKNVWTDVSGSNFRNGEVEYAVKLVGEDRVLFGTDAQGMPYHTNIGKINEADISEEAKEKIFYKNALTVFGEDIQ